MKTTLILISCLFVLFGAWTVSAQVTPPPGAGDKTLGDNDIKGRSNELERVKRDADKPSGKNAKVAPISPEKFLAVKHDFEDIQRLQNEIVTAYSMSKQIQYDKIALDAGDMNKSATRLESNLFPEPDDKNDRKKKESKKEAEPPLPQDLKSLIVEQDNTLAAFVGNPMFTNPNAVTASDNEKAHSDLRRLIKLSTALQQEAGKAVK